MSKQRELSKIGGATGTGTTGDVLTKTATGYEFAAVGGTGLSVDDPALFQNEPAAWTAVTKNTTSVLHTYTLPTLAAGELAYVEYLIQFDFNTTAATVTGFLQLIQDYGGANQTTRASYRYHSNGRAFEHQTFTLSGFFDESAGVVSAVLVDQTTAGVTFEYGSASWKCHVVRGSGGAGGGDSIEVSSGNFTPTLTTDGAPFDPITYNTAQTYGQFKRVGDLVSYHLKVQVDSWTFTGTASGSVRVSGLPYAAGPNSNSSSVNFRRGFITNYPDQAIVVGTNCVLYTAQDNNDSQAVQAANIVDTSIVQIFISGVYFTTDAHINPLTIGGGGSAPTTGTFTATLTSGATTTPTTTSTPTYQRIGDRVHIQADLFFGSITVNGTPLEITCTGIPTPAHASDMPCGALARCNFDPAKIQHFRLDGSGVLRLEEIGANAGTPTAVNTEASGTFTPRFGRVSITYRTDDP